MNFGSTLEAKGWLQGCIIPKEQAVVLLGHEKTTCIDVNKAELVDDHFVLVVASQSCDIARDEVPSVQLLIARIIEVRDPHKSYNAHPRILDTHVTQVRDDGLQELSLRVSILEKVFTPKENLIDIDYLDGISWGVQEERSYRNWLGEHYDRPALPTSFNNLLKRSEKKLKITAKQSNDHLYGIYIRLNPNRELVKGERYDVQLLGALTNDGDIQTAQDRINRYKEILEGAGINVTHALVKEKKQISMAMLEGMTRFHWDYLSYRNDTEEFPAEVSPGI
ncbi:hypothetical protein ACSVJV_001987 [Vibrio cholerae]|uniref:hypothetical protein n=1 Tax=Vibrio cholerae TaxID=666 RepID=UPI000E6C2746|nr:hypothetical protein [Vibrio cholerae]AYC06560.1 hypothetical protein FORC73_2598 [Vibrio cholerae]EGR0487582.1 hypothetical protein [Vibrio cholerae]EGR0593375.1 hypothetical protein [Vibrio cholerae]EGR2438901.1 hypothetical protein [Vibrio cholerae]EKF9123534.1 hypothetical protein [Vibrio cholerae]